ncbi:kinesin-like protein KIF26B isoform X2 [Argiope bruennichi]|nr:kinesin-like protein KIF26B isoform X2 [Argiope bruennichi]XP_055924810.1 kinesin-like protein KIF26B isoform X2 [Argiope bruennichi]XP_055924899.1 kinesin-like protein KIF26B isoform X2 [Argiope bruennichi]
MSRQGKGPTPPNPTVPGPVAQQAQQYLEQNIMAWMQPKPQGQQILSSTLSSFVTTGASGTQTPMSQKALQEHNLTQTHGGSRHQLPMTSPYSPIGGATSSGSYASPSVAGTSCMGMPPSCSSIPHSLSFSGYSHHSLLQGTSFSSPCPSTFGSAQPSAAASFFARAAQRLNLSSKKRRRQHHHPDSEPPPFLTNFAEILRVSPPPVPPSLLRSVGKKENFSIGKVKVMLRIKGDSEELNSSFLNIDARKKQITVYDLSASDQSSPAERRTGVSAPKMFAFDAIFSPDDAQAEVCSSSLPDVIQAVVGGTDGCLFVYGQSKLGKTHTMVGKSDSPQDLGVMPCAISWLFRLIYEQRQKTGARFSVRVSALELSGRSETLRDLLSEYAAGTEGSGTSPGVYLRDDPIFGAQLINQSELRAPTAEKAAYLLDAALAARNRDGDDEGRNSHFLFTLHLYQYRVERGGKGGVAGGRSRLHLFDLGSCDKISTKPRDGGCLSLSALGNVILALFNGQKHVPYKESKLTQLLKEAMSSLTCRVAMIAHISSQPSHYSEILGTIQLASRVHRMRRKKIKYPNVLMDTDEKGCVRPYVRMHAEDNVKSGSSDPDYTSSSEQSCDTVIYVGNLTHNERDFTDNEGPPTSLPIVPKLKQSQNKSTHGTDAPSSLERKRHNSISKTQSGADDQRKSEDKSSNIAHTSTADSSGHHPSTSKATKSEKMQQSSKNSPLSSRHQPASTQTQGAENAIHGTKSAQSSTAHTQRKSKHRSSQKQDQGTGIEQPTSSSKIQLPTKPSKMQSDETWIDGPRFTKPKFDSKTLHQLQKEQWVDGPPNIYGFMDHHKQNMIQRWIEEHSQQIQSSSKRKNEVWIDYPSNNTEKGSETQRSTVDVSGATLEKEEKSSPKVKRSSKHGTTAPKTEMVRTISSTDINLLPQEEETIDEADSASNSADVDETDNEENAEASGYDSDLHILQISQNGVENQSLHPSISASTFQASLPDDYVETIEVYEPEESVPMVDSCLQVTEEDILAEYWLQRRHKSSENPLPEVDQSSCGSNEHPLRILSEEDLNLPSSFTDSRSVSVDLDSISVPDTREGLRDRGAVTWRLLYGNMFQRIKEQQQKQRRTADDLATVKNNEVDDKLERISKLRDLIQPLTRHRSQTKVESIFKTCPISRSGSRYTMPEILGGSRDSSMEDLSAAEVTSTQSEPADLDLDKYDYKLNIKPMNGLKLEEFYKKIQKVPPFLEQYSSLKPTQIVPPLTYEQENLYLVNKLENQRSESATFINNSGYKQFSNSSYLKTSVDENINDEDHIQSTYCRTQTNSTTLLHKPSSTSNLQRESAKFSSSENTLPTKISRTATDLGSELERRSTEKRDLKKSTDTSDSIKRGESKQASRTSSNKTIDTTMLTVGQSPSISPKSRLHRGKIKNGDGQSVHSQQPLTQSSSSSLWSRESSISSSTSKMPHRSGTHLNNSSRSPGNKNHISNGNVPNGNSSKTTRTMNSNACKLPTRSSPTSSSTSGVTTMCCAGTKSKDKTPSKTKPVPSHSKQKQSAQDSRKSQRTKSICRSTSSPSTCVDSGDTAITDFTDSEHYHAVRHASVSGALASPYHKVPHVHVSHHHHHHHKRTSSGHGSESSVNSSEPREAKELLLKGAKTQQFSGTSSGYESMLRDSEGTPLSSSQESGNEDSMEKGERGRKGRRRSNGSSKRSSSAPARSPPSPLGPSPATAISQQPLPNRRSCRRGERALHRSDEEVCCTSLLCCRLLDFY